METTQITVQARIAADLERVWEFWTQPEHIVNWNFASDEWHCPAAENDLRTGGKFNYRMASRDGQMGFDFEGTYDEVIHQEKIIYSMPDARKVLITFEKDGDHVIVTETFDAENTHSAEMQKAGWQAILDNFKKLTEA